jgi:hypothetical protein
MGNQNNKITLKDWYQIDFLIDGNNPIGVLKGVVDLMEAFNISRWFFLWEPVVYKNGVLLIDLLRVRFQSDISNSFKIKFQNMASEKNIQIATSENEKVRNANKELENSGSTFRVLVPFSDYEEDKSNFFHEDVLRAFADIMSEATQLTIKKFKKEIEFKNYRVLERISHCLFNNIAGKCSSNEIIFLDMRASERKLTDIPMQLFENVPGLFQ